MNKSIFIILLTISSVLTQNERGRARKPNLKAIKEEDLGKNQEVHPIYGLARDLYLIVSENKSGDENILISPFSIRTIMGVTYLASRGKTSDEIQKAFYFPEEKEKLTEAFKTQIQSTMLTNSSSEYDVGNGVFIKSGVHLNEKFSRIVREQLKGEVLKVPFYDQPEKAAKLINTWVGNITRGHIPSLIESHSINKQTSVILANALFFSGKWGIPFQSIPENQDFEIIPGKRTIKVPMMVVERTFSYGFISEIDATGISIPFKNNRFEFVILKPNANLEKTEELLKNYPLNKVIPELKKTKRQVILKMPKFYISANYGIDEIMQQMGVKELFTPNNADLSGLFESGEKQHISKIIHQTLLEINEQGAIGSAGTILGVYPINAPFHIDIDRPFFFFINDRVTGPVFIGRIVDPEATVI